jgi:hypothetical protein
LHYQNTCRFCLQLNSKIMSLYTPLWNTNKHTSVWKSHGIAGSGLCW